MSAPFALRALLVLALALAGTAVSAGPQPPPALEAPAPPSEPPAEDDLRALERQLEEVQQRVESARRRAEERADHQARDQARQARRDAEREMRRVEREAQRHRRRFDNQVSIGSSVHVQSDEVADDVVAIGGSVVIDGMVDGDAVAVAGSVRVNGVVRGNVTAVAGAVRLGPQAEISGDVTSVGGKVERTASARVDGHISEVSLGQGLNLDFGDWFRGVRFFPRVPRIGEYLEFAWDVVGVCFLFLVGALFTLLVPAQLERVRTTIQLSPWKAGLVGFAVELLFLPLLLAAFVLLCISIIGIPVAILGLPIVVLLTVVAFLFGFAACARAMGEFLRERFNLRLHSPYALLLLGIVALESIELLGNALDLLPGGFLWPIRWLVGLMGFLVLFAAWTIGLGAVCLRAFERRRRVPPPELPAPPLEDEPASAY